MRFLRLVTQCFPYWSTAWQPKSLTTGKICKGPLGRLDINYPVWVFAAFCKIHFFIRFFIKQIYSGLFAELWNAELLEALFVCRYEKQLSLTVAKLESKNILLRPLEGILFYLDCGLYEFRIWHFLWFLIVAFPFAGWCLAWNLSEKYLSLSLIETKFMDSLSQKYRKWRLWPEQSSLGTQGQIVELSAFACSTSLFAENIPWLS